MSLNHKVNNSMVSADYVAQGSFHLWPFNFLTLSLRYPLLGHRYNDVIVSAMASQIPGVSAVCSTVCSGADQRKHQSSASLAFVRGICRSPVDSPHKGPSKAENAFSWWRHHVSLWSSHRDWLECGCHAWSYGAWTVSFLFLYMPWHLTMLSHQHAQWRV